MVLKTLSISKGVSGDTYNVEIRVSNSREICRCIISSDMLEDFVKLNT